MSPSATASPKSPPAEIEPAYRSLDQCAKAMQRIAEIDTELQQIEADTNERINPIREAADKRANPLNAKRLRLSTDVEEFMRSAYPKGIFEDGSRTLEFMHGKVAFKDSPKSVNISKKGKWTEIKVIEALKALPKAVREICVRSVESINKKGILSRLSDLDEKQLKSCGLVIEQTTNFSILPNLDTAKPSSQTQN